MRGNVILACCKSHFIREHENLANDPSNNISIIMSCVLFIFLYRRSFVQPIGCLIDFRERSYTITCPYVCMSVIWFAIYNTYNQIQFYCFIVFMLAASPQASSDFVFEGKGSKGKKYT